MTVKFSEDMKKTSFACPLSIIYAIRAYNEKHPDDEINTSAVCRKALRTKLKELGVEVAGQ